MDLTVNLFTSFGYFDRDSEHTAALNEMIGTVRPEGWFVIDFLNAAAVRRQLVPEETLEVSGATVRVSRSVSPDGRYVCKSIHAGQGRQFRERVRLFEPDQMAHMLEAAGVTVQYRFGDYDANPLRSNSPRTILAGRVQ
jgi:hypothetical protein